MKDDDWIEGANRTIVVFCDAKKGAYDFNDAWTNRDERIMESFLALVGVIPRSEWPRVANELYKTGRSELKQNILITALLIHHDPEQRVSMRLQSAQRIQIEHALRFIHRRFNAYHSIKTPHGQWEASGHTIWDLYNSSRRSEDQFVMSTMLQIGMPLTDLSDSRDTVGPEDEQEISQ